MSYPQSPTATPVAPRAPMAPPPTHAPATLTPADHIARRNLVYVAPTGTVRMHCQNPACPAAGLIVGIEREAVDFAISDHVHLLCRDCRHRLNLLRRPTAGPR